MSKGLFFANTAKSKAHSSAKMLLNRLEVLKVGKHFPEQKTCCLLSKLQDYIKGC